MMAVGKKAIKIPVQVNGKLRGVVSIESLDLEEKKIAELANKDSKIRRYLKDQDFDIIYVKGKILNFVTK